MDNMLQMKILTVDTRSLYVPTSIKKLTIDAKRHIGYARQFGDGTVNIPIHVNLEAKIIKSGAIEIVDLEARSITRRKPLGEPVLERHVFVPNEAVLSVEESVRVAVQIALENHYSIRTKTLEIRDEATPAELQVLSPLILQALGDQPLIQAEVTVFTSEKLEIPNATIEDKKLGTDCDAHIIVATNVLTTPKLFQQIAKVIKDGCFLLSRQNTDFNPILAEGFEIILRHFVPNGEQFILLRKKTETQSSNLTTIEIQNDDLAWLQPLQQAIKSGQKVVLYAQNRATNGIMGLFNCLRRELGGVNIRCVFVKDEAPPFDATHEFYAKQLEKDLALNVYQEGKWGTYRHLLIEDDRYAEREHAYVNVLTRGDLSTLKWIEGPLASNAIIPPEKALVHVYSTAINFRDIMTASGRISADVVTMDRLIQDCVQGFEFAGKLAK